MNLWDKDYTDLTEQEKRQLAEQVIEELDIDNLIERATNMLLKSWNDDEKNYMADAVTRR